MSESNINNAYTIEVRELTKSFGGHPALRGIDLTVTGGECIAIFGPNGAGKTTLIKILSTLSRPSKGQVYLAGMDTKKDAVQLRRLIGVVSHQTFLYDNLTARENLTFYGKMYDVPDLEKRISEVINKVELANRLHDRVEILSRGMQQRLSIARAILHDPPIMLLDEPETGLDQNAVAMLTELLKTLTSDNRTVLVTTHNMALGLALGSRLMILHRGRIAHEDSTRDMKLIDLRETYNRCTGVTS